MEIKPTPDQEEFIRQAIKAGRFDGPDEAVKEALALWENRERRRAEILIAIDEAEASIARGDVRVITQESMNDLAEEVGRRGRERLAKERRNG